IGKTNNLKKSLDYHEKGAPPWVDIHKVIGVEEVIPEGDEKTITLEYMSKYGWTNVRGFAWKRWDMQKPPKELRKKIKF
ncbi:MAG: hypothetical protein ACFFD2_20115, partial [Promethearchaeota archaeon]